MCARPHDPEKLSDSSAKIMRNEFGSAWAEMLAQTVLEGRRGASRAARDDAVSAVLPHRYWTSGVRTLAIDANDGAIGPPASHGRLGRRD